MTITARGKFLGRCYLYASDERIEWSFWSHELDPDFTLGRLSVSEWARMYFTDRFTGSNLDDHAAVRELFGLPAAGDFQVLFDGEMVASYDAWSQEHDEDFNLGKVEFAPCTPWQNPFTDGPVDMKDVHPNDDAA